jgi:catechol 2,3-dioxygenase-like lactoylglutathione lyase family enzyme
MMAGMTERAQTGWWGVVLDAPDAGELARFYSELLGWPIASSKPKWATVGPAPGNPTTYLGFQTSAEYVRPVWPPADGRQQQMLHLDIGVSDVGTAVAHAVAAGATLAEFQPQDDVRVMLDPAGHPFCLYLDQD